MNKAKLNRIISPYEILTFTNKKLILINFNESMLEDFEHNFERLQKRIKQSLLKELE